MFDDDRNVIYTEIILYLARMMPKSKNKKYIWLVCTTLFNSLLDSHLELFLNPNGSTLTFITQVFLISSKNNFSKVFFSSQKLFLLSNCSMMTFEFLFGIQREIRYWINQGIEQFKCRHKSNPVVNTNLENQVGIEL